MKLSDVQEYLEAHIRCDQWYVGKIDRNQEHCIGVYPAEPVTPVISLGGVQNTTYATKSVSVLVHWGHQYSLAEAKAIEVYSLLFGQSPVINGKQVIKIDFRTAEPVGIGTDDKGIYEFILNFIIYYRKE